MIDFIHVGDFKTGSTWLQRYAFKNHPEILYLGNPFEDKEFIKLNHELMYARDLDFDMESLKKRYSDKISQLKRNNKIVGMSDEWLSTTNFITGDNTKGIAERLKGVFGETKIIYIIREQFSMLASIYSQYVKEGGTLNFNEFFFDPFLSQGLLNRLKYHKTIDMYKKLFGQENVYVGIFEEFKYDKKEFIKKMYKFIGCKDYEYNILEKEEKVMVNQGLTTGGIYISRLLNRFFKSMFNKNSTILPINLIIKPLLINQIKNKIIVYNSYYLSPTLSQSLSSEYKEIEEKYRLNYLIDIGMVRKIGRLLEKVRIGKSFKVSPEIKGMLSSEFIESNKILIDRYQLDLQKYNYQLEDINVESKGK